MITVGFKPSIAVRNTAPNQARLLQNSSNNGFHTPQDRFSGRKHDVPTYIPAQSVPEVREKIADSEKPVSSKSKTGFALTAAGWGALATGNPLLSIPLNLAGAAVQGQALKDKTETDGLKKALDKKIK